MTKDAVLMSIRDLEGRLRKLRIGLQNIPGERVNAIAVRQEAESLADLWVEGLRSTLEFQFKLPTETIEEFANGFKRLHVLSRRGNRVSSYRDCLSDLLRDIKNKLILPIQQLPDPIEGNSQLKGIVAALPESDMSEYLSEAIACEEKGFYRASIIMGWCAAVDHIQNKLIMLGLDKFNVASTRLKNQTSGRFRRFHKEFKVATLSELQEVFDTDLLWILEGMQIIDSNQGDRLRTCFQYRNQSAHPGLAPIGTVHLIAFFNDIFEIILLNQKLSLTKS